MLRRGLLLALGAGALLAACSPAQKTESKSAPPSGLTPIRFATDWRAQAE